MYIHYVWIGPPQITPYRDGIYHDITGPIQMARTIDPSKYQIYFWCLDMHVGYYEELFSRETAGYSKILVRGCEYFIQELYMYIFRAGRFLEEYGSSYFTAKSTIWNKIFFSSIHTDFVQHFQSHIFHKTRNSSFIPIPKLKQLVGPCVKLLDTFKKRAQEEPSLRTRYYVNIKNFTSFLVLYFFGGYFLDTNVIPNEMRIHLPDTNYFKIVAIPEEGGFTNFFINNKKLIDYLSHFSHIPKLDLHNKNTLLFEDFFNYMLKMGSPDSDDLYNHGKYANTYKYTDAWLMSSPPFSEESYAALSTFVTLSLSLEQTYFKTSSAETDRLRYLQTYRNICASILMTASRIHYFQHFLKMENINELPDRVGMGIRPTGEFWESRIIKTPTTKTYHVDELNLIKHYFNTHKSN